MSEHPDAGDQTRERKHDYQPTYRRLEEIEHDLGALQAYCDLALQERLATLEAKVDELMHAMERLGVPRHPV